MATRRLFLFRGMAGAAAAACTTPSSTALAEANTASCALTPEQTVGPYYLNLEKVRQDITEGRPGIPLKLRIVIVDATRGLPIENAALDIWHCDALGTYSGFLANGPDGPPGMPPPHGFGGPPPGPPPGDDGARPFAPAPDLRNRQHDKTTFLRGVQLTDAAGVVEFSTICPGWYMGRDIHIHMRVHIGGGVKGARYEGGDASYSGQLFFPEDVNDVVATVKPYGTHHTPRTRQDEDDVFTFQHGRGSIVTLARVNNRGIEEGLVATSVLGIDPTATSKDLGPGGNGPRQPGWPQQIWPGGPPIR